MNVSNEGLNKVLLSVLLFLVGYIGGTLIVNSIKDNIKDNTVSSDTYQEEDNCDFLSKSPNATLKCYSSGELIYDEWIVRYGGALCTMTGQEINIHNMECVEESR